MSFISENRDSLIPTREEMAAMMTDRALHSRETHVRRAELHWVEEVLGDCVRTEGVNAKEQCSHLVRQYVRMLKTHQGIPMFHLERNKYFVSKHPEEIGAAHSATSAWVGDIPTVKQDKSSVDK